MHSSLRLEAFPPPFTEKLQKRISWEYRLLRQLKGTIHRSIFCFQNSSLWRKLNAIGLYTWFLGESGLLGDVLPKLNSEVMQRTFLAYSCKIDKSHLKYKELALLISDRRTR